METNLKGTLNLKTVSLAGQPEGGFKGTSQDTLTVWPIFGAPVASQQSRILRRLTRL
jgi:hypothetical protein